MALAGIPESINTEVSALLGTTVFAANRAKQGAQEQLRPTLVEDLRKSDFVSLSAKALQLSRDALTNDRTKAVK